MKPLTRRERALIQHAKRRAIANYKDTTHFKLEIPRTDGNGQRLTLVSLKLSTLEGLNKLHGEPVFFVSLFKSCF